MNTKTSGSQNIIHHQLRAPTVFLLLKLIKDVKNILTIKKSITLFLNFSAFTDFHLYSAHMKRSFSIHSS